jgi:membrane protein
MEEKPVDIDTLEPEIIQEPLPPPMDQKDSIWKRFSNWIWTNPEEGEPYWEVKLKAFFRVTLIVLQEFARDNIPLRASALTFTVVLSLVPMLALGTAVLKGLGAGGQMRQAAYTFIETFEFSEAALGGDPAVRQQQFETSALPDSIKKPGETAGQMSEDAEETLQIHLRRAVDTVFNYVDRTNFTTLGALGILGLLITVIFFLGSIEQALNAVWQSKTGRPISQQIMNYLGLMVLLPVAIYLALASMATLQSQTLVDKLEKVLPMSWIGAEPIIFKIFPILAVIATFTIIYKYLPSSYIKVSSALIGGIIGGLGWILVQSIYLRLQFGVARYNAIYGSFATLPLLLLWIYVAWIIFLTGAEVSFASQVWQRYERKKIMLTPIVRLAIAFDIIESTLIDFKARKTSNQEDLSRQLRQPEAFIAEVLKILIAGGIIRRVNDEEEEYMPTAPAEEINPAEIVGMVLGTELPQMRGSSLAYSVLNGARNALEDKKIGRKYFSTVVEKEG